MTRNGNRESEEGRDSRGSRDVGAGKEGGMKKEMSGGGGPGLPTFFVFLDLMEHVELQAGSLPLLPEGTEVEFDLQTRSPRDASKTHALSGVYVLERRVLKCGGRHSGMAQYLEWRKK